MSQSSPASPASPAGGRPPRPAERLGGLIGERVLAPALQVVPRTRPRGARAARVPFVALVGGVLLAGILGLLVFNTSMQQGSFAASSLEARANALEARRQTLQMQIEDLRDPQRVARQARRLGMVSAGAPVFLDLSDGSVHGDAVVAQAQDGLRIEPTRAKVPEALQPERIVVVDKSLIERAASRREAASGGTTESGADEGSRSADE